MLYITYIGDKISLFTFWVRETVEFVSHDPVLIIDRPVSIVYVLKLQLSTVTLKGEILTFESCLILDTRRTGGKSVPTIDHCILVSNFSSNFSNNLPFVVSNKCNPFLRCFRTKDERIPSVRLGLLPFVVFLMRRHTDSDSSSLSNRPSYFHPVELLLPPHPTPNRYQNLLRSHSSTTGRGATSDTDSPKRKQHKDVLRFSVGNNLWRPLLFL